MNLMIVCYHYFREEKYKSGIYPVDKALLDRQTDAIAKGYEFISQSELIDIIHGNRNAEGKNLCLITFDDGLSEQMNAFDFLKSKGIPSIYYAPTSVLKNKKVLEVHKLHHVRTLMNDSDIYENLEKDFAIGDWSIDEKVLNLQYPFDDALSRKVKYYINFVMNAEQKSKLTDMLFSKLVDDEEAFSRNLYMTEDDLHRLAQHDALGAHGTNHVPLATLSFEAAEADVKDSINYLEKLTGSKMRSFAYPYGGRTAVNEDTWKIFHGTHVEFAHTTWPGVNDKNKLNTKERFYLQRVDANDAPGGKNASKEFEINT